jgi:hypothetical protein
MSAVNLIKDRKLVMLQEGMASSDDAVQSRIAVLLLSDTDPIVGSCGGLITSYRRGLLRTAVGTQAAFAYASAVVKVGLLKAGDTEVSDIRLSNLAINGTTAVLTVTLALTNPARTISFNLQLAQ